MLPRFDTEALKATHPIEDVVAGYGVDLRPSGRVLIGRCPFHPDGGRPNLVVYAGTRSWYCFRCAIGGDAIAFVMRIEDVPFPAACRRLDGTAVARRRPRLPPRPRSAPRGPDELACLAAAVELYQAQLDTAPAALAYARTRGLDRATLERCRIGYAAGGLAAFLRWRRLPLGAAVRTGLLRRDGAETLAGRLVVPEVRRGQPLWLVGRLVPEDGAAADERPRYLGLPGPRPLLGWEDAARHRAVFLAEGILDWLLLRRWGLPAVGLGGTGVPPRALKALARFDRVYAVLDDDEPGHRATAVLVDALGPRAVPVPLPGVRDVGELASRPAGLADLVASARRAERALAA
jgi:DNA primase